MMIVDTNIIVRAWARDDELQAAQAIALMTDAERIYIATSVFCEFVWVARQIYKQPRASIVSALRLLISDPQVEYDRNAVAAGLSFLEAGGDFADGVIEFEGRRLGGDMFVTFDKRAAAIVKAQGRRSLLLTGG